MKIFNYVLMILFFQILFSGCTLEKDFNKIKGLGSDILANFSFKNVNSEKIQERDNLIYLVSENKPYSGKITDKYPNGSYKSKMKIKKGKLNGKQEYYYKKILWIFYGGKNLEAEYKDGLLDGDYTVWDNNFFYNKKRLEGSYKRNLPDGKWISYFPDGKSISKKVTFKNGYPEGEFKYSNSREYNQIEAPFKKGLLNGELKLYYSNGQIKLSMLYENGYLKGPVKVYSKDGEIIESFSTENGDIHPKYAGGSIETPERDMIAVGRVNGHMYFEFYCKDSTENITINPAIIATLNLETPLPPEKHLDYWKEMSSKFY